MSNRQTAIKVRIKAYGQRAKTVYVKTFEKSEGRPPLGTVWTGEEVDHEGTPVDRIRIVCESAIVSQVPVIMNHRYGEFEPV